MTNESVRKQVLADAEKCICQDRDIQYGPPEDSFRWIAKYWSDFIGTDIEPWQAAFMMALFKAARVQTGHYKRDNFVDMAGYIAIADELFENCKKETETNSEELNVSVLKSVVDKIGKETDKYGWYPYELESDGTIRNLTNGTEHRLAREGKVFFLGNNQFGTMWMEKDV